MFKYQKDELNSLKMYKYKINMRKLSTLLSDINSSYTAESGSVLYSTSWPE